jgi:hypothetical protein
MTPSIWWLAGLICATTSHGLAFVVNDPTTPPKPFPRASVRFEQNATDGDVEVVFEITGRSDGLAKLRVVSPDGRTVVDFKAPDASTLGIRQFVFESPEPTDVAGLKAAYPEGTYTFLGETAAGARLHGKASLKHELPPITSFVWPTANAKSVGVDGLRVAWAPVEQATAYIVEIEQDELKANITARLPAIEPEFAVPAGFLRPNTAYQLGIGTVAADGNISYIETTFTTGAK